MTEQESTSAIARPLSRRTVIRAAAAVIGTVAIAPGVAIAQTAPTTPTGPVAPASSTTSPPRQWGPDATNIYPDPDIISVDPSFGNLTYGNTNIKRIFHNPDAIWHEGPAWSAQGRYLVWSDVARNIQWRYILDDGRTTEYRNPSNNSNGNTFDFEGRQISCEHLLRRVIRWEHDGTVTVVADSYNGQRLNSPNDVVPHPDGSIWFTDPPYGGQEPEGQVDKPGGPSNPNGHINPRIGGEDYGGQQRSLPTNVYRVDPSGKLDVAVSQDQLRDPNGLAFSPDYKKLYVISTGKGPGDTVGGDGNVYVFDVASDNKTSNMKLFTDVMVDGIKCGPDGIRADVDGNMWISSNAGSNGLGYNGVTVWSPQGQLLGRIRIPEVTANIAFGGLKRNYLFMAASTSIYSLLLTTQGAAPA
ncbi:MAG: SMP-30/gluconolactonase/LRE family protein [Chloroflexota bacterium]|nr:SMP-30/gluconolactonase/LRE family protein [Chloroflexota bacterium]